MNSLSRSGYSSSCHVTARTPISGKPGKFAVRVYRGTALGHLSQRPGVDAGLAQLVRAGTPSLGQAAETLLHQRKVRPANAGYLVEGYPVF